MKTVTIQQPFYLVIGLLEIEQYLPSAKMQIEIKANRSSGSFSYFANDIWIHVGAWNDFIASLKTLPNASNGSAMLNDMSDFFIITIVKMDYEYKVKITCKEPIVGRKDSFITLMMEDYMNIDAFYHFKQSFVEMELFS